MSFEPKSFHITISAPALPEEKNKEQTKQKPSPDNTSSQKVYIIGIGAIVVFCALVILPEIVALIKEIVHDKFWRPNPEELEEKAKTKFSHDFISKIKQIKGLNYIRLLKRLAICKEEEKQIFQKLEEKFAISNEQLKEIFMGAHVRLDDNGETYKDWTTQLESKNIGISSHPSFGSQYRMQGPVVKEILFSQVREDDGKIYTWFQFENAPVTWGHLIRHTKDYVLYKIYKENQGPDGASKATHHNPIILTSRVPDFA